MAQVHCLPAESTFVFVKPNAPRLTPFVRFGKAVFEDTGADPADRFLLDAHEEAPGARAAGEGVVCACGRMSMVGGSSSE